MSGDTTSKSGSSSIPANNNDEKIMLLQQQLMHMQQSQAVPRVSQSNQNQVQVQIQNQSQNQNMPPPPSRCLASYSNRLELLLKSFSFLLSSAHSHGVNQSLLPPMDSDHSPSNLLTRNGMSISSFISIPSLKLRSGKDRQNQFNNLHNNNGSIALTDIMALSLATPLNAHRNNIDAAPLVLLHNTTNSFQQLIASRLRISIQAFTRTLLKIGGKGSDTRILRKLLTTVDPIKITTVVTSFQIVDKGSKPKGNTNVNEPIVIPLLFETIVDISIFGKMYTVNLEAPGTISASLNSLDQLLDNVEIVLDTVALLRTMMTQARAVVKKAVKRAAIITTTVTNYQLKKESKIMNLTNINVDRINQQDQYPQNSSKSQQQQPQQQHQNDLLASYPEHLRETVQHFLPSSSEIDDQFNMEGFPPNLLNTLKELSGEVNLDCQSDTDNGDSTSTNHSSEEDERKACLQSHQLTQGLFSWIHNDDMILKQSSTSPQLRRNKKVSFSPPL